MQSPFFRTLSVQVESPSVALTLAEQCQRVKSEHADTAWQVTARLSGILLETP